MWWHFRRAGRPPPPFLGGCSIREWPSLLLAQWPKTIFALGGGEQLSRNYHLYCPGGGGEGPVGGLLGRGYQILSFPRRRRRRRRSGVTKALTFIPVPSLLFLLALATYPSFVSCLHCRDGGEEGRGPPYLLPGRGPFTRFVGTNSHSLWSRPEMTFFLLEQPPTLDGDT